MTRPIALVNRNNIYASCRPVERGQGPRGRHRRPLAPAKDRHAGSGIVVRSSNYTLYGDLSARVMRVLSDFTPELEVYSIDEAFLSFGGFEHRLEAHARQLRATVL